MSDFKRFLNESSGKGLKVLSKLADAKGFSVEDEEDEEDGSTYNLYDDGGDHIKNGTYEEIKSLIMKSGSLREGIVSGDGDEVEFTPAQEKQIKDLEKLLGGNAEYYLTTIHGIVISFKKSKPANTRLTPKQLQGLVKLDVRWHDGKDGSHSVGI